jgi:threonine dehydratase
MSEPRLPVTYEDVQDAHERLQGVAHRTPVFTSRTLNEICCNEVLLKCENFQRMGAFKFRGAYNALAQLSPEQKYKGVITFSSGNHAQAVALAGKLLGIKTVIVMPKDAPKVKLEATRGYGAEVILYDPDEAEREVLARQLMEERGLTLIPPFDHPHVIAGQGTAAKELFEDVGQLDYLFVPCGGGGLLSGSLLSAQALSPQCKVYGVEPEAGDDGVRSFRTGVLQRVENPQTIADGARTPSLGVLTFAMIKELAAGMLTASDEELVRTMRFLWERMKIIVEPTGVLGLAPLFHGRLDLEGKRIGVILSGGNVDLQRACELFARIV